MRADEVDGPRQAELEDTAVNSQRGKKRASLVHITDGEGETNQMHP